MDDYYGDLKWNDLLKICDRYGFLIEYKGGSTQFMAKHLFITSNSHPSEWYPSENVDVLLSDRINLIYHIDTGNVIEFCENDPELIMKVKQNELLI